MTRIEKTVFISYRRTNFPWAYCIYQDLTHHGYDVFFDYQSIDSGNFEKVILDNIRARAHFIVILAPSALERCKEPSDWLRREIETAIDENRNIIPIMLESFDFGSPIVKDTLTGKLGSLSGYNGMSLIAEYMEAGLEKLRKRYLNIALENTQLHTLLDDAKAITESQKAVANSSTPIDKEELSAQEWFERGYVFDKSKNSDEAIRCFTKAIELRDDFALAFTFRGLARRKKEDLDGGNIDFDEAIRLGTKVIDYDPKSADAFNNRGAARLFKGDLDGAIEDFSKAINIRPDSASDYKNRGTAYQHKGDFDKALSDFNKVIDLNLQDSGVYVARGIIRNKNEDIIGAIEDFSEAIKIEPNNYDAFYNRGRAKKANGDMDGALKDYSETIRFKPDFANAFWGRGNIYWSQKDYFSAAMDYQRYFDLGGTEESIKPYLDEARRKSNT